MTLKFRRSSTLAFFEDRRLLETLLWISFEFFQKKKFFSPKLELLNLGCGLSVSASLQSNEFSLIITICPEMEASFVKWYELSF